MPRQAPLGLACAKVYNHDIINKIQINAKTYKDE